MLSLFHYTKCARFLNDTRAYIVASIPEWQMQIQIDVEISQRFQMSWAQILTIQIYAASESQQHLCLQAMTKIGLKKMFVCTWITLKNEKVMIYKEMSRKKHIFCLSLSVFPDRLFPSNLNHIAELCICHSSTRIWKKNAKNTHSYFVKIPTRFERVLHLVDIDYYCQLSSIRFS